MCSPNNIDCRSFDQSLLSPRILSVDTVEEWTVSSGSGNHVMHLATNPFTVCEDLPNEPPAPHWRDSLTVTPTARELHIESPLFTGDLVMVCQELDLAELGMAELVRIAPGV